MAQSPWEQPPRSLRLSDADREHALSALGEHYRPGRLTSEEFDDRSREILRAKSTGQFTDLFADLPQDPAAPLAQFWLGRGVPLAPGRERWRAWLRILFAVIIVVGIFSVLRRVSLRILGAVAVAIVIVIMLCVHRGSFIGAHPLELAPIGLLVVLLRKRGGRPGRRPREGLLDGRFGDRSAR